jgi:ATP adenylyltransferase
MNHQNLWAPWRMAYLRGLEHKAAELADADAPAGSFLVQYWNHPERDEDNHVLLRDEHGMILLNRYPYANGHLMVALGDPRPTLLDYEPAQRVALWRLVEQATDLMQRTIQPQGINMGINQGAAAGAGVPEHLHAHLVPRWHGDTNFISVVGEVRIIPESLDIMASEYRRVLTEQTHE